MRASQYSLTDSQDDYDDSEYGGEVPGGTQGVRREPLGTTDGGIRLNLKLGERLFLFSFDLIEMNSFYNYVIMIIFVIADFFFIAYFPLDHIYTDFVVP